MRLATGVTDQLLYFVAIDSADHISRKTGLSSFTVYRSRNGGTATAYTTPTITEMSSSNMPGVYKFLIDEDMTIDSGDETQEVALHITCTGMDPVTRVFELYRPKITAGNTLVVDASGLGDANVVKVGPTGSGTAQTARDIGASVLLSGDLTATMKTSVTTAATAATPTAAAVTGAVGSVTGSVGSIASGGIAAASFAANAITAAAIAADAIGASELAADAVTEIQSGLATAANLATVAGYIDTEVASILSNTGSIKAKTDSLTFDVAGVVSANITHVNATAVTGDGHSGTEWGPV